MGRLAALAAALIVLAAGTAGAARASADDPKTPQRGVWWGGQVFTTPDALARWLEARGANYDTWAARHPAAAAGLAAEPKPEESDRAVSRGLAVAFAFAFLLLLAAAVPKWFSFWSPLEGVVLHRRFELAGAGLAILLGASIGLVATSMLAS